MDLSQGTGTSNRETVGGPETAVKYWVGGGRRDRGDVTEAKNKLSEVVRRALEEGPQRIERRGEAVLVISASDYERLTGATPTLKELLFGMPDLSDLDLERDESAGREIEW